MSYVSMMLNCLPFSPPPYRTAVENRGPDQEGSCYGGRPGLPISNTHVSQQEYKCKHALKAQSYFVNHVPVLGLDPEQCLRGHKDFCLSLPFLQQSKMPPPPHISFWSCTNSNEHWNVSVKFSIPVPCILLNPSYNTLKKNKVENAKDNVWV